MIKLFIAILTCTLLSFSAHAQFDLKAGGSMRTYPSVGGELFAESGYNMVLWGAGEKSNPLYGLIRPALKLSSSAVINQYDARIELYPISFIALIAGHQYIKSDFDKFTFFDCDVIRCKGTISRDYFQGKMALAFGPIVAMGNVKIARNSYDDQDDTNLPVGEFKFVTLANAGFDTMYKSRYLLGWKLDGGAMIGLMADYAKFSESKQEYHMDLMIYTAKSNDTTYVIGLGNFESTHQGKGVIGVFQFKTDFLPSKKLF